MLFVSNDSNKKSLSGGNGYGYEGKIQGVYVRSITGHTCEGHAAPQSLIKISEFSIEYIVNETNNCGVSKYITFAELDSSNIENGVLGYAGGVYSKEIPAAAIPMHYEAWCTWENEVAGERVDIFISRTGEQTNYQIVQEGYSASASRVLEARSVPIRTLNFDAQLAAFRAPDFSELVLEIVLGSQNANPDFPYDATLILDHPLLAPLSVNANCRVSGEVASVTN